MLSRLLVRTMTPLLGLAATLALACSPALASEWSVSHQGPYEISGLSCASASLCVAGDTEGNILSSTTPTGSWSLSSVDNEELWGYNGEPRYGSINAVSCAPSTTSCFAVDNEGALLSSSDPTGGPSAWSILNIASYDPDIWNDEGVDENGNLYDAGLDTLSCPSSSACYTANWEGEVFSSAFPGGFGSVRLARGTRVKDYICPSPDIYYTCTEPEDLNAPVTETATHANGHKEDISSLEGSYVFILASSCPTSSFCVLGDTRGDLVEGGSDPSAWSAPFPIGADGAISAISCPTTTLCVVADEGDDLLVSTDPEDGASATWTKLNVDPEPGTYDNNEITNISCPSTSLCVATDFYGGILTSIDPANAVTNPEDPTSGPASWSYSTIPAERAHPAEGWISSLSCPSTSLCVAGDSEGNILSSTDPGDLPPYDATLPSTTGTPSVGEVLTAVNGTWAGSQPITFTYQWQRCEASGRGCTDISGATGPTYTLEGADAGHSLDVEVTATNAYGTAEATSVPVGGSPEPAFSVSPAGHAFGDEAVSSESAPQAFVVTNTGDATLDVTGATLTGADPSQFSIGTDTCTSADLAPRATCQVDAYFEPTSTGSQEATLQFADGASDSPQDVSLSGTGTSEGEAAPAGTALPIVSGTPEQGDVLSTTNGTWTGSPTSFAYQWLDCNASGGGCTDVSGATSTTYTLTGTDVGHTIEARVTATNGGGSASATSNPTALVAPEAPSASTPLPAISGTPDQGDALSTTTGAFAGGAPASYSYQWYDGTGTSDPISGATSSSYTLQGSDVGSSVHVVVTATNSSGSATEGSELVGPVAIAPPVAGTPVPTISGSTVEGHTLLSTNGTFTGGTIASYAYQWHRGGPSSCSGSNAAIADATSASYVSGAADVGDELCITVTATNASGQVTESSAPTAPITAAAGAPPVNTVAPVVSGTPQDGLPLTTDDGTWTGKPSTFSYQWHLSATSSCSEEGADVGSGAGTIILDSTDAGHYLCVTVTATNSAGSNSATSAAVGPVNGSTAIASTGRYVRVIDNDFHTITVEPQTTEAELVDSLHAMDSSTQVYEVNGHAPNDSLLQTGDVLDVQATDPAEEDYDVVVGGTTVTGDVTSGTLSLTPAAYESWSTQLSPSGDTVASYSDPIDTNDNRGSGQGWHETVTSTSYVGQSKASTSSSAGPPPEGPGDSGDQGLSSGDNLASSGTPFAFGVSGTGIDSWVTGVSLTDNEGSTDTNPTSGVGYTGDAVGDHPVTTGLEIPQASTAPAAVDLYDAAYGTGLGNFTLTPDVSVAVPANAYDGYYSSVVTLAIVSGP